MLVILFSDHTYIPHRAGGRESSINDLANILIGNGYDVTVIVKRPKSSEASKQKINFSYHLIESASPFNSLLRKYIENPECKIIASVDGNNFHKFIEKFPYGSCLFLRDDQGFHYLNESNLKNFEVVANSPFIASKAKEILKKEVPVFPPLINLQNYKVDSPGSYVTFINPVVKKGVEIAFEVASKLPDIPFLFCEGWPISDHDWGALQLRANQLGNIKLIRRSLDMKKVYCQTKILIVPSQWEEAWGRVVTEAQVSGIPAIVSNVGGLSDNCGEGGYVINDKSSVQEWSTRISQLYSDENIYKEKSDLAIKQSNVYSRKIKNYISDLISQNSTTVSNSESVLYKDYDHSLSTYQLRTKIKNEKLNSNQITQVLIYRLAKSKEVISDYRNEYLNSLYVIEDYEAIIDFIKSESGHLWTDDALFIIADSAKQLKDWELSSFYWEKLYLSLIKKRRVISEYLLTCLTESMVAIGKIQESIELLEKYIEIYPDKNVKISYQKICELLLLQRSSKIDYYSDLYGGENPGSKEFFRFRIFASYFDKKSYLIDQQVQEYVDKFESTFKLNDWNELIYILCELEKLELAYELNKKALSLYPEAYKGFKNIHDTKRQFNLVDLANQFSRINSQLSGYQSINSVDTFFKKRNSNIICSWPGTLYGNKYMENFRNILESSNYKLFPIEMPSEGVISSASLLIIQFPDAILWRNRQDTPEILMHKMMVELLAIYEWKKYGVRIAWIVHNLIPHDISNQDRSIWEFFYHNLGQLVDVYASMCPSNQAIIQKAIPSLANKKYQSFLHPTYNVENIPIDEIRAFRKSIGVSDSDLLIGIIGSISLYKGINDIIEAFKQANLPNVKLLISGAPRSKESLEIVHNLLIGAKNILLKPSFMNDKELDLTTLSCDKLIIPNSEYLNSGSLIYSLCANKHTLALRKPYSSDVKDALSHDDDYLCLVENFSKDILMEFIYTKPLKEKIDMSSFEDSNLQSLISKIIG